jgi:putative membrane protein
MRGALTIFGVLVLAAVWAGPFLRTAPGSFSAHMAMHIGVVAVAAPLLALGLAGTTLDPVRKAPAFFPPIPASIVELVVVWAWHAPVLHHAARHATAGLVLEQATFLLSGLYLWLSAFGGDPARRANRAGAGILALLLTSMHMTLLGALLALPPRPLYAHEADATSRLTPLEDQHLGGAIMIVGGGVAYLLGGLGLMVEVLGRRRPPTPETRLP